ncbi:hypothetical protein PTE_02750 [Photorhabdus khanii NC19]|uniref:Uncharacterized protein n=1 Tax=Photorhabdus khanii NC19 TaxID=1004151 RepID=W3V6Y2_9GAMM|nr:hypothetical protein PTE_02750 [Photorhabdus khanii NC19]
MIQDDQIDILTLKAAGDLRLKGIRFGRKQIIDREKVLSLHGQNIGATQMICNLI